MRKGETKSSDYYKNYRERVNKRDMLTGREGNSTREREREKLFN